MSYTRCRSTKGDGIYEVCAVESTRRMRCWPRKRDGTAFLPPMQKQRAGIFPACVKVSMLAGARSSTAPRRAGNSRARVCVCAYVCDARGDVDAHFRSGVGTKKGVHLMGKKRKNGKKGRSFVPVYPINYKCAADLRCSFLYYSRESV